MSLNNIFVLDDEPSIGIILNLNLKDSYNLDTATSVAKFELFNQPINGMVLDLNIGAESGLPVLEKIRSGAYTNINKNIPVIILSAEEDTKTKIACLEKGADDFMVKPFNPRELKARLNRVFSRLNG